MIGAIAVQASAIEARMEVRLSGEDDDDDGFGGMMSQDASGDIPAETASSESGMGQYEITLTHGDALKAADNIAELMNG
mgnify:CR=1 FL=1